MQMSPLKIRKTANLWLSTLFITFFLCLDFGSLPVRNGIAAASPIISRDQHSRPATRGRTILQKNVELVSATAQGVTIQLLIPKSDFHLSSSGTENGVDKVESQVLSFPGCRFTAEPGTPRLPCRLHSSLSPPMWIFNCGLSRSVSVRAV